MFLLMSGICVCGVLCFGVKKKLFYILRSWLILILCLSILICGTLFKVKPIVSAAAINKAKLILTGAADEAILSVMKEENIKYDDIAIVTRREDGDINGIEINCFSGKLL